ncbi:DNA-directed RNA polymerase III subunit RPC1 [Metopolophium dirhodum]|uniref:DNA-directed RNA polymerase III subunit RPC1 n=1 Tax=Metopolophium dirhodum TaxID=44670 RepID=UPI00299063D7|nr:DNA-directed RNA polymerase III subunit RPC1 [Metopolophium dirhodum]
MVKEQYRDTDGSRIISKISFTVDNPQDIQRKSHLCINTRNLYAINNNNASRTPHPYGVLDHKLGVNQKDATCMTCNKGLNDCPGHLGFIDLQLPVFHVGFFSSVITILQTICKNPFCAKVLLNEEDRMFFYTKLRNKNLTYTMRKKVFKEVHAKAKKVQICPFCSDIVGQVKKNGILKISYDRYRYKKPGTEAESKLCALNGVVKYNKEVESMRNYLFNENLNPQEVLRLLLSIPYEDIILLGMNPEVSNPGWLLMTRMLVPPNCIRPSAVSDIRSGTNEDDLTLKLSEVLFINDVIVKHKQSGAKPQLLHEDWEYLQLHCALYINSDLSGVSRTMMPKKIARGCVQRLKGKHGRFRGNLSGKRVDFTARSVISPDPNLRIEEVGVPVRMAKILTYPQKVCPANIELMRKLVMNGPEIHPGANFVELQGSKLKKYLRFGNRPAIAKDLKIGDIVERHLSDGDIVLFNRQPSLHRLSIMCHRAKVLEHNTLRFNECVCTPYNADFDGDEMNLHLPQTEEARAEAALLMINKSNLVTPRNGDILIAATQDFITGAYLLTHKNTFLNQRDSSRLIGWLMSGDDINIDLTLPRPAILKPHKLWTGKQILSIIMRPSKKCQVKANLRCKGKSYTRDEEFCFKDSYVYIRNSELLAGTMDKATLGSGSKSNIFYVLLADWGSDVCCKVMWRLTRLTSYFLMLRGFSIGIGDVTPSDDLLQSKNELVINGNALCEENIRLRNSKELKCQPGCNMDETLEANILKQLSGIRDSVGKACLSELHFTNGPLVMALSGSKGSNINISQMIACVGQQALSGHRVPDGFESRSLPHFKRFSKTPEAKGFVENSFYSGLTPTEFFFHTMGGREGLVDTAVKTAETGYMQRRLVKSLEDLCVHYDNTVRNAFGDVIQFEFGGDSLDPTYTEGDGVPVDFKRVYFNVTANYPCTDECTLDSEEILKITEDVLLSENFQNVNTIFTEELRNFGKNLSNNMAELRKKWLNLEVSKIQRITYTQLIKFYVTCLTKYMAAVIEPGTPVGAIAAQSIGEPGTQMTLKTFHFAGVASMNITQGVPRIKEIINSSKNISTPIITAYLENDKDKEFARIVKARIEQTTLTEVCSFIDVVLDSAECYLLIHIDMNRIKLLQLEVTIETIRDSILSTPRIGIKANQVNIDNESCVSISLPSKGTQSLNNWINIYSQNLQKVVIKGISAVSRAVIHEEDDNGEIRYKLLVEGDNLREVMATPGVIGKRCTSNNTFQVWNALGIEASRATIISEIDSVMGNHGISIDPRHPMLIADLMTSRGELLGITRFGLSKMKESVLNLASFEKTSDHLFDAAYYGQTDTINGVSESIIMGIPINLGTGFFKLIYKTKNKTIDFPRQTFVFDDADLHEKGCYWQ